MLFLGMFIGLVIGAGIGVFVMAFLTQGRIADLQRDNAFLARLLHEESQKLAKEKRNNTIVKRIF